MIYLSYIRDKTSQIFPFRWFHISQRLRLAIESTTNNIFTINDVVYSIPCEYVDCGNERLRSKVFAGRRNWNVRGFLCYVTQANFVSLIFCYLWWSLGFGTMHILLILMRNRKVSFKIEFVVLLVGRCCLRSVPRALRLLYISLKYL